MNKYKRIKEVFTDPINHGIFSELAELSPPWAEDQEATPLNIIYHEYRSGDKIISPIVYNRLTDGVLDTQSIGVLAIAIYAFFGSKWNHVWDALNAEYDPLDNYNMIETGSGSNTRTGSEDNTGAITRTGSERTEGDTTRSGSQTDSGDKTGNQSEATGSIYGFNSSNAVPADTQTGSESHSSTLTYNNLKDDTDYTKTYNSVADTDTRKKTYNNVTDTQAHELRRHGNIGVTTSQQMLESEMELRKHLFFDTVMTDIDSFLTIAVY